VNILNKKTKDQELGLNFKLKKMETISFDKLLLKTAFCCMASDGHIDNREIELIKSMCEKSPLFKDFKFEEEINQLVIKINARGKEFIQYYFDLLSKTQLSEQEELTLIDFAIKTINADEKIEYSEVKFFKVLRHHLKINDEKILSIYPDIESWLEQDIITENYIDKIKEDYLNISSIPQFDLIQLIDKGSIDSNKTD
jgi:uncharacterized tellurite resistance protein B-like protein